MAGPGVRMSVNPTNFHQKPGTNLRILVPDRTNTDYFEGLCVMAYDNIFL
jgi:hypothetical protein